MYVPPTRISFQFKHTFSSRRSANLAMMLAQPGVLATGPMNAAAVNSMQLHLGPSRQGGCPLVLYHSKQLSTAFWKSKFSTDSS